MTDAAVVAANSAAGPTPDPESAAYWAALREHRIVLQRCPSCERIRFPWMPGCPYCGSALPALVVQVSGLGQVYSFVRVHRALTEATLGQVPYVVAVVQLDAGPRMVGRVAGGAERVRIADAVRPAFVDHQGWTELRFDVDGGDAVGSEATA
ncbi:MAG TPA: OB-fold domain-containing protein [Candidatus Dormibacteraeota bacterium]|nr:OB-fold domain-containing protein [Candidatus Dormibacteraeota bacterium]